MFIFHSRYLKPIEEVDKYLDAHRAWLKTLYNQGITVCSGPKIPRTGGTIMLKASSREEAVEIMKNDPYAVHDIAEYEVIEFEVKSYAEGFSQFVNS